MNNANNKLVLVVGAGLAGCEAAYYLANCGIGVVLADCKRINLGPHQKLSTFGELVCSNSLKSSVLETSHGLLKSEMREFRSLVLEVAELTKVRAGDALAVDRVKFSQMITDKLQAHPLIQIVDEDVSDPVGMASTYNCEHIIITSGPLTTGPLTEWIQKNISGVDDFYFYDAIAPVVEADSLDFSKLYFKDRYKEDRESADYLNAPMNKVEYERFIDELLRAQKVNPRNFEVPKYFEACLPIDTMAQRGRDTPRFSCMKPVGLEMEDGTLPYAVVQFRNENLLGSAYNLVGFQTRLTHKEQLRIFRMIPGLINATFLHLGSIHRNSFLNARKLLNFDLSTKKFPNIGFAGQICGVEGYTESAAMGIYTAFQLERKISGKDPIPFPKETAIGALVNYIMTATKPTPSNINFGILPAVPLTKEQRRNRKELKKIKKRLVVENAIEALRKFKEIDPLS